MNKIKILLLTGVALILMQACGSSAKEAYSINLVDEVPWWLWHEGAGRLTKHASGDRHAVEQAVFL